MDMLYSEKVMDHFSNPRNVGELENPSGVGTVGNAKCGDIMKVYLDIDNGIIKDVKFKTFGCGAAVATSSMATEMIKGKTIEEALTVTNKAVMEALDGLPPVKVHCSVLAEEAVMAGGVDSSVAAYLLKQQGYDVIGVIMQIWQDEDRCDIQDNGGCCGYSAVNDARKVADKLDIPFYVLNFKNEFKDKVIDYFIDEYYLGRTPNPCIACNRYVKWESLLAKSVAMGADYIATGHYAKINRLENGRYAIQMDFDNPKDQSYALYNLTQYQLAHTLMPVNNLKKQEVRSIAEKLGLDTANKPDSQEICFIADNNYGGYIAANGVKDIVPGKFIDEQGNVLGNHKGIIYYTVGQRKGLGIAFGKPMFVKSVNPLDNTVVLCEGDKVFSKGLRAGDINFMGAEEIKNRKALVKIRYSHKPAACTVSADSEEIICEFDEPQRAVTPGQAAVFYDEDGNIICGGTIEGGLD